MLRADRKLRPVRRVAIIFLTLAWLCANGLLWDAMQLAAWGKMFAGYSETMTVTQALRETLDPTKPCELCVGIAKAKDATEKQVPATENQGAAKFVLALHVVEAPVFASGPTAWSPGPRLTLAKRTQPVPVPPPRG